MELPSLSDKVCLITGANSGIGKATAQELADHGATVIMVCRNQERGKSARSELIEATGNERIDLLLADLSSQYEVRNLASTVRENYYRLDVLVNNAGLWLGERQITEDGFEKTLAVNYLAPFLLTNLLLDLLEESQPARIVNVGSDVHKYFELELDDLQRERSYNGLGAYGRSKAALVLFTYELARRLKNAEIAVNCVHPGTVNTNLYRASAGWLGWATGWFRGLMGSVEKGARGVVYLAAHPDGAHVSGQYFHGTKQKPSSDQTYDDQLAAELWKKSEKLTGLA